MESAFIESAGDWSSAVFGASTLPDARLGDRLEAYGAAQAVEPTASTAAAFRGDGAGREGAYRLLENPRVEARDIEEGPFQHTAELVSGRSRVLAIQDTSSMAVKHRPLADALKQQGSPTGFVVHSNLMVDGLTGEPLGLIAQDRWTREQGAAKRKPKKNGSPTESMGEKRLEQRIGLKMTEVFEQFSGGSVGGTLL